MGFLLIILAVMFLLNTLMPPPGSRSKNNTGPKMCPPHKWIYGADGFLYCDVCKGKPGYEGRE